MSLYGMMRTGVSGMNAQANRLSSVADNIANSNTTGYKRSTTEFSSLVLPQTGGNYTSGGVTTTVRNSITQQGDLRFTTSGYDLAVSGEGFFVVQDAAGKTFMTRAGAFTPDDQGRLVNAAGFTLMGYSYANGVPSANANGFGGLVPVNVNLNEITASPSQQGVFSANLPAAATPVPAANLPSTNAATAQYTSKSSLLAYDNLGREVILDVYSTKTADDTWQVTIFNQADAAPDTSFPYGAPALATQTLTFDPANKGKLAGGSADSVTFTVPGGQSLTLDLSGMTQLGNTYSVGAATIDGSGPTTIENIEIANDGIVYAQYGDGSIKALYRVPLATVPSPDQLTVLPGNVFAASALSGGAQVGFPGEGKLGSIMSGALESSNVDVAEELTNMIESQRGYTANSKVFQTGAELMDVLVNLKR
ncbi:flagellar hook protein FlgE [Pseudaminobacter sp. 19-2017]|uniref:Flagellar hook protein FlgE n=1 Tax=Pseudaminobacter soli (ex Zhang et al. 2022) TaxID=2831468 RepID=A0A942IAD4_9HYPH|nr:flagellar hook protein FlgE [Pseudaminobacter soli]MBS3650346.1 flagellar hook protein FlgE [Pseudaminobacter soli]